MVKIKFIFYRFVRIFLYGDKKCCCFKRIQTSHHLVYSFWQYVKAAVTLWENIQILMFFNIDYDI